jgi:hypothetical protein
MYIIYVLRCPISNEVRYVGQTRARVEKRLSNHIWESRKIKKKYSHKDNWILKLSKLELKPIIEKIEEISLDYSLSYVLERETYWILKYRTNSNLVNGGEYSLNNRQGIHKPMCGENNPMWNKKHSNSAKKIMSEKKLGLYDGVSNPRAKSLYQYDDNLTLIKKWKFAKECCDFHGFSRGNVSSAAKTNSERNKDFIVRYGFVFSFVKLV